MKKIFITLLGLVLTISGKAEERTSLQMESIATKILFNSAAARGIDKQSGLGDIQRLALSDAYGIYGATNADGFVIVSRDDLFRPVLGYSDDRYDEASMPPAMKWWLEQLNRSLKIRKANGQLAPQVSYTPVSNFLNSKFGQTSPYNDLCPLEGNQRSLTGCIATALAQILKYYKYPEQSTGSSYYRIGESTTKLNVKLNTTFDWANINMSKVTTVSGDAKKKAIAELMRDCGYAARMNYSANGSGTTSDLAATGLTENLGFSDQAVLIAERDYYDDTEWATIIYRELANKRPILAAGTDPNSGGHAFVFCGVNDEGLIYVNWGWNGKSDGFYDMTDMAPTGIQGSTGTDHFNEALSIIYQITPNPDAETFERRSSQFAVYNGAYILQTASSVNKITVKFARNGSGGLLNFHYVPFYGKISLAFKNKETGNTKYIVYRTINKSEAPTYYNGWNHATRDIDITSVPAGNYSVQLVTKYDLYDDYVPVRNLGGVFEWEVTKGSDGVTTVGKETLVSGIETTSARNTATAAMRYTLDGRKMASPRPGINIVRMSDGTVRKVLVK